MSQVLIFGEFANGQLKKGTLELLTAARTSGLSVSVCLLGTGAKTIVGQLNGWNVSNSLICDNALFDQYNPEFFSISIANAITASGASIVLASSNMLGRDLFPRVAARLSTAAVSDCTELTLKSDGTVNARRPLYSGKCTAEVSFLSSCVKILLMRANQMPVGEPGDSNSGTVAIQELPVPSNATLHTLIKDIVKGTSGKLDLTEANIIVSGGRGLKEAANFKLVTDLADVCGATTGASRAIVDAGWVPHSMQVGQTGKTVAPSLYIAIGISGAIQHMAGMSGSKIVVAINKDANAPIFQKATYGLVGDLFEIVPALTQEFKALLS